MARKPSSTKPPLWQAAASFAARVHKHQTRKDGQTPYFAHCSRVATTVATLFGCTDEVALAAAFLHDVIEDCPVDYDEVADRFGGEVANCVAALTKNATLSETSREREYDRLLAKADWRARLIKLADVYDNWMDAPDPAKRAKVRLKCRRAIELATPDARSHPETARAIRIVSTLA